MKSFSCVVLAGLLASGLAGTSGLKGPESLVQMVESSDDDLPANTMAKVLRMVDRLKHKINNETEMGQNMHHNYMKWCAESETTTQQEIDYHQGLVDKFYADLTVSAEDIKDAQAKIDEATTDLMTTQTRMKRATDQRNKELADYEQGVIDLKASIKAVNSAKAILEREMAKNPAALTQIDMHSFQAMLATFGTMMDAVSVPSDDVQKLMSLIQNSKQSRETGKDSVGDMLSSSPPQEKVYTSSSGDIFKLLVDMEEKASTKVEEMHQDELTAKGEYAGLIQSLGAQEVEQKKVVEEHKQAKQMALMVHAESEKSYSKAKADLDHNQQTLKDNKKDCAQMKADHEQFLKDQQAEIDTLDKAIELINQATESVGGVQDMTSKGDIYAQQSTEAISLLQESSSAKIQESSSAKAEATGVNLVKTKVVGIVKRLAKMHKSSALMQMASRMKVMLKYDSNGADPFDKVKGLISDMIRKLEDQLSDDTSEKKFCDREMKETKEKLKELGIDVEKLDRLHEASYMKEIDIKAWLKEIAEEVAAHAAEEAEKNKLHNEYARNYRNTWRELTDALEAVQKAISMLEKFYGAPPAPVKKEFGEDSTVEERNVVQHDNTMDAAQNPVLVQQAAAHNATAAKQVAQGQGIIDMLRLVKDDLAASLEDEEKMWSDMNANYAKVMEEYLVSRQMEGKDKDFAVHELDDQHEETGHWSEDEHNRLSEKEKVAVYYLTLRDKCITRGERFDDRKQARDDEIAGLKQAMDILRDETASLMQTGSSRSLRGGRKRHQLDEAALGN